MSTDFSLDALLNGSTSSSSVSSPQSSKSSPQPVPQTVTVAGRSSSPTSAQLISVSKVLPTPPTDEESVSDNKKGRNKKRAREDDDEQQPSEKKVDAPQPKKKRVRTAYTRQQLQRLEFMFAQNPYPDMLMRENIAEELGLPDQKIHVS